MQGTLFELIVHAGLLVKAVLLVLVFLSILSWSIIIAKYYSLAMASKESDAFVQALEGARDSKALVDTADALTRSPLARLFMAAYGELSHRHREDDVRKIFSRHEAREEAQLHSHLIVLATTGATAPFIGLLGTVWGIMDAFRGIGATGSASLAVVAPAIAEALITTAAGLAVAIPAVMAYNFYVNWVGRMTVELDHVSEDLQGLFAKKAA